jgi:hypothetical protein
MITKGRLLAVQLTAETAVRVLHESERVTFWLNNLIVQSMQWLNPRASRYNFPTCDQAG